MSRHDRCMVDTLELELAIYGQAVSPSVLARVKELDEAMRRRLARQYGGYIPILASPPPPPRASVCGPTKAAS